MTWVVPYCIGASSISRRKVSIGASPTSLKKNRCSRAFNPATDKTDTIFQTEQLLSAWRLKRADGTKFHNLCLKKSILWTTNCTYLQSTKLQTLCEKGINIVSMYDLWRLSPHESWCRSPPSLWGNIFSYFWVIMSQWTHNRLNNFRDLAIVNFKRCFQSMNVLFLQGIYAAVYLEILARKLLIPQCPHKNLQKSYNSL